MDRAIQDMKSPIDNDTCKIRNLTEWLNQQEVKKKISEKWYETLGSPKTYSKPEAKLLKSIDSDFSGAMAMCSNTFE